MRSLISAEKRHLVYFPGGNGSNHVQRLNTYNNECETIKLLTFAPRCLVAESGWLCCGSETGEFVAIKLEETDESHTSSPSSELVLDVNTVDTRSPSNPEGSRNDPLLALLAQARQSNKSLIAKSMKLAADRVNCVTLWFPPTASPASVGSYQEPVAVLANNDRTVVLVSLNDFDQHDKVEALEVVQYPDYVNRAIISPDGGTLVGILDDPYLYVHERVTYSGSSGVDENYSSWELRQRILLKSQMKNDSSDRRGSFAACYSPSGAYLAVGTQHGTISIFDTTLLLDPSAEPLITTFKSSRPDSVPGAIRDMAFCPGPFDILAWTEDRGHIGLADMRSNFIIRQIVDINKEADFRHIEILDRNTIDPRLLEGNAERRQTRSPPSGDQPSRRLGQALASLNQPLRAEETAVLEAIQSDRRRRERVQRQGTEERPRGGPSDLTWAYLTGMRSAASGADSERQRPHERSSSLGRSMSDILDSHREQRERQQERMRSVRQLARETPARQGSNRQQTQSQTQTQTSRRPDQRWMDRIGDTVAAMRSQRDLSELSPLHVLEILQARERTSNEAEQEDPSLLVPLVNQVVNRWEESAIRGTLATDHGVFEVPPSPDNTAGVAWTEDGRTL